MSMIKKLIALTLALAMVLSVSAFAGSYSADTYADADKIDSDCEDAVELLYALDIMVGDGKNFNPESAVTRAEMAKMIYVILNYGDDDKAVSYTGGKFFSDVASGIWYEGYVNYAAATKLVQGRPDGTFGPNDPVTCAEAAKMLLTAIGYSAEARGYTGANWDKNVLSDASIIGLLDGYKANTNTYAPRQWVAVMMANALDALTYETMQPSFSGLLTSGSSGSEWNVTTMGDKYYGIDVVVAYAMATEKTSLYTKNADVKDIWADDDCVLFEDGDDVQWQLEDTGLTVADLGQEYKIILIDGDVVSVRNTKTSVVAESLLRDLEAKTVTGTSSNKENNKYEFTVDEFTGKLESYPYVLELGSLEIEDSKVAAGSLTANALYAKANGKTDNVPTTIKVIDKDADGKIDYVIYTNYAYAMVDDVATSRAYGDYIKLTDKDKNNIKIAGLSKLYISDVIDCEDELEEGNYVKYTWDHDNGELDIEVLAVVEDTLDRVTTSKKEVKIGGEAYVASDDETAYGDFTKLTKSNVGDTFVVAIDGDMLVVVADPDSTTTLEGINAQLCVVTDKTTHYYTGWDKAYAVEIMNADGEISQHIMVNQEKDNNDDGLAYSNIKVVDEYDELDTTAETAKYLYVYSINDDNEIVLSELAATAAGIEELDEDEDVINGYYVGAGEDWEVSDDLYGDEIVLENIYFVLEDDELTVKTLEELEGSTAENLYWEGLYDNGSKLHSMVAGFIAVDTFAEYDSGAYLYLTDDVYSNDDDYYRFDAVFADGTTDEGLKIDTNTTDPTEIEMYTLYKYTIRNDKYTLTKIDAEQQNIEITVKETNKLDELKTFEIEENDAYELVEKFTGDEIYVDTGASKLSRYDLTDCIIAVKSTILDLDRDEDDVIEVTYDIEFVTLDELKEMDEIFNSTEENDDWYFSDFTYDEEELFYVELYRVTEECQSALEISEKKLEDAKEDAIEALLAEIETDNWNWSEEEIEIGVDAINAAEDATDLRQVAIDAVRAHRNAQ